METKRLHSAKVIDLFCGVGGLALGALRAGFDVVGAVDNDSHAGKAFTANFPICKYIDVDISKLSGSDLLAKIGIEKGQVAGIMGGPPCQGFSILGHRNVDDERNCLFDHFFRLVEEIQPRFYLAENVPGVLDAPFAEMRGRALARMQGYHRLAPLLLKASDFGAATSRERVFFIGALDQHATLTSDAFAPPKDIPLVNVRTALQGLRRDIHPEWQSEEEGWRALASRPKGGFWEKVFNEVPEGVGNATALRRLSEENRVSGCIGTQHTKAVTRRFASVTEGGIDPVSRATRLERKGFCPTLRSGTGPERGSFQALRPIHPTEPRVITPREAARLQGFPDWFVFDPTKWHSFRHIGNSVSPILAEAILRIVRARLSTKGGR